MNLEVNIGLKLGSFQLDIRFESKDSALGIFGPSGCGKTTLLRCIAGLARPDNGYILLNNEVLFDADRHVFIPPHQRNIGVVFQDARLFPHWSVEQNLRAGACIASKNAKQPYSFNDIVDLLDILHLIDRTVNELSGGEKQRIAIGRTLLTYPRLLLLDEPVSGLDMSLKMQILPFLSQIRHTLHIPVISVSHNLDEIVQLTDQILLIRDGNVAGQGSFSQLMNDPVIRSEFSRTNLATFS